MARFGLEQLQKMVEVEEKSAPCFFYFLFVLFLFGGHFLSLKKRQAQRANVPPLDSAKNDAKTGN